MEAHGGGFRVRVQELALGHAADEHGRQFRGGHGLEGGPEMVGGERTVLLLVEDPVQDERPGLPDGHGLGEQVAEEVDGDPTVAQHVGEPVVFRARPAHPQHVVEEERVLVAGGEPFELEIGPVQDDAAQPPGLGVDMESHASILTIRTRVHPWIARAAPHSFRPLDDKPARSLSSR